MSLILLLLACKGKSDDTATTGGDGGGTSTPPSCADGLPARDWVVAEEDEALLSIAASVTLPTAEGDLVLSELWDGCDIFLFLQDSPRQADSDEWPRALWSRDVDDLFAALPPNVRLFLGSNEKDEKDRAEALAMMREEVEGALLDMADEDREWWTPRVHWVEGRYQDQEGWLGDLMRSPGWGVWIDREQRIRFVGSYADVDRYSSSVGWFEPNVSMAANEAVYGNYLAARAHRLSQEAATVVRLWDKTSISDPGWAGERAFVEVELPSAAEMAAFDTLELDLDMGCVGDGEYGDCPPWDYIAHLYLCAVDDPDDCSIEFGRWITTYHREGRFVHDATPLLPLLREGGTRRFAFYTQQEYEITLDLRLQDTGGPEKPTRTTLLFLGDWFDLDYNDGYRPVEVEIPASARRVELATVISGHGQVSPGNCAEFCVTEHIFTIDGTANTVELSNAGTETGCMEMAGQGVVPNQYGTWWYGRSGWCPGWQVPVERIDVTDQVTPGGTATISYQGFRSGQPYSGSGANIVMTSWLTVYE